MVTMQESRDQGGRINHKSRVRKNPDYDGVCFHAQPCAEKHLKARVGEADVPLTKIHDLVALLELVVLVEPCGNRSVKTSPLCSTSP